MAERVPIWVDEHGRRMQTRPCHRRGRPVAVGHSYRHEHMRKIRWALFAEASYVEWCGHGQQFIVVPHGDGETGRLVPILGEAG